MTREEAIKVLENPDVSIGVSARIGQDPEYWRKLRPALDMAISALRQQDVTDKYVGKMTNAQKIRAMNDEELAEFLDENADYCHVGLCEDGETCRICCLKWLKQPVEEDDHES